MLTHNKCVKWIVFPLHFKTTTYAGRYIPKLTMLCISLLCSILLAEDYPVCDNFKIPASADASLGELVTLLSEGHIKMINDDKEPSVFYKAKHYSDKLSESFKKFKEQKDAKGSYLKERLNEPFGLELYYGATCTGYSIFTFIKENDVWKLYDVIASAGNFSCNDKGNICETGI